MPKLGPRPTREDRKAQKLLERINQKKQEREQKPIPEDSGQADQPKNNFTAKASRRRLLCLTEILCALLRQPLSNRTREAHACGRPDWVS
jgi:hypothetical protein